MARALMLMLASMLKRSREEAVVVPESEAEDGSVVVPEEEGACVLAAGRDLRVRGMVTVVVIEVSPELQA